MLAERIAQICNGKLDKLEASHSGSVSLGKSPSLDPVPGPSNQDLREIPIDQPIMANPWRSYETTFWWEDTKELELVSGARLPADAIEFRDPCAYPTRNGEVKLSPWTTPTKGGCLTPTSSTRKGPT